MAKRTNIRITFDDDGGIATEHLGPIYPNMPTLAKFRRRKNETPEQGREYGEAVCAAIRAMQRSELMREVSTPRPNCASGTAHTDGLKILAAVNAQNRAAFQRQAYASYNLDGAEAEYARQIASKRKAEAATVQLAA